MGSVLRHDVHVTRLVKGEWETHILKAGQSVPKSLRKFVTNPKAYVDAEPEPEAPEDGTDERDELVAELAAHDLPTEGSIEELRERLAEFTAENTEE